MEERDKKGVIPIKIAEQAPRPIFTKEMKKNSYYISASDVTYTLSIFRISFFFRRI